jgi:hypothetical protein
MRNNNAKGIGRSDLELCRRRQGKDPAAVAVRIACKSWCDYFNGSGGEEECGGFSAVFNGLRSGTINSSNLESIVGIEPGPPRKVEVLAMKLCALCDYQEDGCDYQSSAPPENATPCGGYRLLQTLLEGGALSADDLETLLDQVQGKSSV